MRMIWTGKLKTTGYNILLSTVQFYRKYFHSQFMMQVPFFCPILIMAIETFR